MHSFIKISLLSCLLSSLLIAQGCTAISSSLHSSNDTNDTSTILIDNLVIAEPLAVNFKSEIAIARLTEVLNLAQISDEQKAQLFYDRGVLYDSVGLRALARFDFSHALKLNPTLIDAYNFLGIHFTQLQEFSQAYENFDSALELSPEHEYAYLNRGIALYYGSRPELAAIDFQAFHEKQQDDPYRVLWLYLTEFNIDATMAQSSLKQRAELVDDRVWAKQVINLYLGNISQVEFLKSLTMNVHSNKELTERLCEAYFYLGKYNQTLGNNASAANYFKLALSTNVYEFVEHRYSKLELDLMRTEQAEALEPEPELEVEQEQ
ncbi:lipoprotein NlpI [Colwellia echini]|uniref:Lipoprotein NlpI n=1 Tax=Colwellia echini TaxID=1982103 RepID=A0ABY3MUL0_9GAMM|nr:lipoprotein NlpI [Colwellia echini]TYK64906.1 lipoprotein NlpI [Colwellia echini]